MLDKLPTSDLNSDETLLLVKHNGVEANQKGLSDVKEEDDLSVKLKELKDIERMKETTMIGDKKYWVKVNIL
jgi:hypothetical protein